jgi:hypothetical protein
MDKIRDSLKNDRFNKESVLFILEQIISNEMADYGHKFAPPLKNVKDMDTEDAYNYGRIISLRSVFSILTLLPETDEESDYLVKTLDEAMAVEESKLATKQ